MLELRPVCEHCAVEVPPDADAMICSFECPFCRDCAERVLCNVCPNCGGGFTSRPVRPKRNWRNDNFLGTHPPSATRLHRPIDLAEHERFAASIAAIDPRRR